MLEHLQRIFLILHTIFSLYNEISNVTIQLDCLTTDNCNQDFVEQALSSDWLKLQSQVNSLRKDLANFLFNSSDFQPNKTCPAYQNCSDQGFCSVVLRVGSDGKKFDFQSTCENSTEQPLLEWTQLVEQYSGYQEVSYTCNKSGCASELAAGLAGHMIDHGYILPFNIPIPSTTMATGSSTIPTISTTTASKSSMSTTTMNVSRSLHLDKTKRIVFAFVTFLLLYLFEI